MTKKILAVLLSVAMVVTVLPTVIFAAGESEECAVITKYADHSKVHCDLAGVKYTMVEGSTVAPECGQDGYTLYKCACGEYFADDIIPMDPHYTAATKPTTERVEPTCSTYGKTEGYTCDNCGKLYYVYESEEEEKAALEAAKTDKNMTAGDIVKLPHDWATPTYPGADCTASEVHCAECGAKKEDHKPATAHVFDYNDPFAIVTDPEKCNAGVAVFKCTNEGCEVTKEVVVRPDAHDLEKVKAVDSSCKKTGVAEHYKCKVCKGLFIYDKDGNLVAVTAEDLVTEFTHAWGDEPTTSVAPTCTQFGADYYFCELCGEWKVENYVEPWGHTTLTEALEHDANEELVKKDGKWVTITEGNCTTGKKYEWTCHKLEHGQEGDGECGEKMSKSDKAKGHTEKIIKVPATISVPVSYDITICLDPKCESAHITSKTYTENGQTCTLPTNVKVVDGDVYELPERELKGYRAVKVSNEKFVDLSKAASCPAHFYELDDDAVNKPATCEEEGYDIYFCATCNQEVILTVAKLGHDWEENYTVDGSYNCDGKTTIACGNGCGETKQVVLGHVYDDEPDYEVKVPNCLQSAGKYFICLECDEAKIEDEVKYKYNPYFSTYEDADAAHGDLTFEKEVEGDCKKKGHVEYSCSDCGLSIWVLDETTGKHLPPQGVEPYEEATCHHGAGLPAFTCDRCGDDVKAEGKPLDHIMTKTEKVDATCTEDGNIEYYTCSRECCKENVAAPGEKEDLQPIKYEKVGDNYVAIEGDDYIIPATSHNYDVNDVAATCTTKGYTHHICTNKGCTDEYCDNFKKATGHKAAALPVITLPDCVTDGSKVWDCGNAYCTGDDGIAGNEDDGIAKLEVLKAVGHKNAAGETIVNKCTDTVTDRVCVNKKTEEHEACPIVDGSDDDADGKADGKKTVGKDCDLVYKYIPEDCLNYGYEMLVCANGCGEQDLIAWYPPLGHLGIWGRNPGEFIDEDDVDYHGSWFLNDNKDFVDNFGKEAIIAYTAPTYETKGSITYTCQDENCCDVITQDVLKVGVDFTITPDNAAVAGSNYIYNTDNEIVHFMPSDGDIIAVQIDISAFETNVWGFNFDVEYNAAAMNFLGYVFHAGETFGNFKVNNILEDDKYYADVNNDGILELIGLTEDCYGTIKVSGYTENGMDGTKNDATITGTNKFITLYFQVEAQYEYTYMGVTKVDFDYDVWAVISNNTVVNSDGEEVDNAADRFGTIATVLLDTNKNGSVNITDLYNCNLILTGEAEYEYLASADANKDGQITITDLDLMNQLLQGADESVIYDALAWTAPEGFVAA